PRAEHLGDQNRRDALDRRRQRTDRNDRRYPAGGLLTQVEQQRLQLARRDGADGPREVAVVVADGLVEDGGGGFRGGSPVHFQFTELDERLLEQVPLLPRRQPGG